MPAKRARSLLQPQRLQYFSIDLPVLLPLILPAILAYICTPAIDWLTRRTRWPRLIFAIGFFLVIMGIGVLFEVSRRGASSMRPGAWHST